MSRSDTASHNVRRDFGLAPPRPRRDDRAIAARRPVRSEPAPVSGLTGRHFLNGLSIITLGLSLFQLLRFLAAFSQYPNPIPTTVAWVLLLVAIPVVRHFIVRGGTGMPDWLFASVVIGASTVVALDLFSIFGHRSVDVLPTASAAVIALLAPLAAIRQTRDVLITACSLGAIMLASIFLEPTGDPLLWGPGFVIMYLTVGPAIGTVGLIRGFRRMVERELDLALVQSTIDTAPFGVGMLASEKLVALDLDAEELLVNVADGTYPLPLSPDRSTHAAQLASALRRRLVARRSETWLHHAVYESEFLGPAVTIYDADGLSGLLSRPQRDGLLEALWLLVGDDQRPEAAATVTVGPIWPSSARRAHDDFRFPIVIVATGVARRKVDGGTWEAIRTVGPHSETYQRSTVRIEVRCVVENPA